MRYRFHTINLEEDDIEFQDTFITSSFDDYKSLEHRLRVSDDNVKDQTDVAYCAVRTIACMEETCVSPGDEVFF